MMSEQQGWQVDEVAAMAREGRVVERAAATTAAIVGSGVFGALVVAGMCVVQRLMRRE